jgi:hypothetical protein
VLAEWLPKLHCQSKFATDGDEFPVKETGSFLQTSTGPLITAFTPALISTVFGAVPYSQRAIAPAGQYYIKPGPLKK